MTAVNSITKSTTISVSLLITLIGCVFWITMTYSQVQQNTEDLNELKSKQESYLGVLHKIDKRLDRIEWALNIKDKKSRYMDDQ